MLIAKQPPILHGLFLILLIISMQLYLEIKES